MFGICGLLIPVNTSRSLLSISVVIAKRVIVHHFLKVLLLLLNSLESFSSLFGSRGFREGRASTSAHIVSVHSSLVGIIVEYGVLLVELGRWWL